MRSITRLSQVDFELDFESPKWLETALAICDEASVPVSGIQRSPSSDHVVFMIDDRLVLKIFRPSRNCFEREIKALEFARQRLPFQTPEGVKTGNFQGFDFVIMTQIPGVPLTRPEFLTLPSSEQNALLDELAIGLNELHSLDPAPFDDDWSEFVTDRAGSFIQRQIEHGVNKTVIDSLPKFIGDNLQLVPLRPTRFLHGDVHFGNLRFLRHNGTLKIGGLFDLADSRRGWHEYELLAVGVLMLQGERKLQRRFFSAYGYSEVEMNEEMRKRLMMLTMLYETSDLRRYALRLRPEAVNYSLEQLESSIWSFV